MKLWRIESPCGPVTILTSEVGVREVTFQERSLLEGWEEVEFPAATQLREYFAGERTTFDVALDLLGTPFQKTVWEALLTIPYGTTTTYGAIAKQLGRPTASRAVGMANGRNPVSIIVPCHRVVGANGKLTGYAGGLDRKRMLLDLESPAPMLL